MKRVAFALLLLFALPGLALGSTYDEIKLRGSVMTDQVNQIRSPDLDKKYFLYKVADERAQAQADERDASGTSEFDHFTGPGSPIQNRLEELGICYNWYGEVIGFSNQLRTSPPAATADDIVDRWEDSPTHNAVIKANSADWGGGSWALSEAGTYFFVYYVVDVCGV